MKVFILNIMLGAVWEQGADRKIRFLRKPKVAEPDFTIFQSRFMLYPAYIHLY